jgi:hypothetical protein
MDIDEGHLRGEIEKWAAETISPLLREGSMDEAALAEQLVHELSELSRVDEGGTRFAPDQFTLSIHPEAAAGLKGSFTDIHASLSQSLENVLVKAGFKLSRRLHVTLATDPTLLGGDAQVIAWHSGDPLKVREEVAPERITEAGEPPEEAFLMVAGRRHFPLHTPEVRIGRMLENDLVLKDPHVSRRHALLRLEGGQYVIHDLKSTAGTKLNGSPVVSAPLRPGDVIILANVEMVYGEGPGRPPTESPPYTPPDRDELEQEVTPLDMKRFDFPTRTFRYRTDAEDEEKGED